MRPWVVVLLRKDGMRHSMWGSLQMKIKTSGQPSSGMGSPVSWNIDISLAPHPVTATNSATIVREFVAAFW
jgi:hypothetical protein